MHGLALGRLGLLEESQEEVLGCSWKDYARVGANRSCVLGLDVPGVVHVRMSLGGLAAGGVTHVCYSRNHG